MPGSGRKYVAEGAPDQFGMRDMSIEQKIGESDPQTIVYRTFGDNGLESAKLFVDYVAKVMAPKVASGDEVMLAQAADWYDRWVYGVGLNARQKGKSGIADLWVSLNKTQEFHMLDGRIRVKGAAKETIVEGSTVPESTRVDFINAMALEAKVRGKVLGRGVEVAREGLIAQNIAEQAGGLLALIPEDKRPKAGPPSPEPQAPAPTGRNRR